MAIQSLLILILIISTPLCLRADRGLLLSEEELTQLSQSRDWLNLGHWRKARGHLKSPLQGPFFLHPQGATEPLAELRASFEAFTQLKEIPTPEDPQKKELALCRYPLRWKFLQRNTKLLPEESELFQQLEKHRLEKCQERIAWKNELNAQSVKLIYATSDMNSASSAFGHTFLKFNSPKNSQRSELLDYAVNYSAITDQSNPALFALKGLLGHYPGAFNLLPYHQKLREYASVEARDIWEYPLHLSAEQVDDLVDHLIEVSGVWQNYYFLSDNCSTQLLDLFQLLEPQKSFTLNSPWALPIDTIKVAQQQGLLGASTYRSSKLKDLRGRYALLTAEEKKAFASYVKSPSTAILSEQTSAYSLEAILAYENLLLLSGKNSSNQRLHQMALLRAQKGADTDERRRLKKSSQATSVDPIKTARSQRVSISFNHSARISYRAAGYDELERSADHPAGRRLEIFKIETPPKSLQWKSVELMLIDILARDDYFSAFGKPSWELQLGWLHQNIHFKTGAGFTKEWIEKDSFLVSILATAQTSPRLFPGQTMELAPSLDLHAQWNSSPHLSLRLEQQLVYFQKHWSSRLTQETLWTPLLPPEHQWSLSLKFQEALNLANRHKELEVALGLRAYF